MTHKEIETAFPYSHHECEVVREHGQNWVQCGRCGAQWAAHASSRGVNFEQISDGDGYCDDNANG